MWSRKDSFLVIVFFVRVAIVIIDLNVADYLSCAFLAWQISVEDSNLYITVPLCVFYHIISILYFHCTASSISSLADYARALSLLIYQEFKAYQVQQELNNIQAHLNQAQPDLNQAQAHMNQAQAHLNVMNDILAQANQIFQQQQPQPQQPQQGQNVAPASAG